MEMFGKTVSDTSKNPDPLCADLDMGAVEAIHGGLCSIVKDVPPKALGQVGRDGGPYDGYAKVAGTFRSADTSPVSLPCVVEVWAEKSDDSEPFVTMMVNRTLVPELISDAFKKAAASARRASPAEAQGSSKRDLIKCCIDGAITKASGGGVYRYSLRQLYYAVRPRLLDYGMELEYGYFCSVVTAIEARRGHDLPGMYRDARGHLYHPHTGETIALGTLNVEKYEQPEYLFNKVLYVEKGGFFPLLIEQKWPERHDCALLTSQGFASRAARDVIDLLGDGDEEITFYAIHDADGPGTAIIEALQEATRARPGRRVKIVNLGLEPAEGMAMKLEVEKVESKAKSIPVGSYVSPRWREWLQDHRIELNAMDSETFVQWLDRKMSQATSDHETPRKLIPPAAVVDAAIEEQRRRLARQRAVEKVLAAVDIDSLAAQELAEAGRAPSADRVRSELAADPSASWRQISDSLAEKSLA